ncbi:MAG TPA: integrase family protein [Roseiarcus sp.]
MSVEARFRFTPERLRNLPLRVAVYHDAQQNGLIARRQTEGGELVYCVRYRLPGAAGSSRMTLGRVSAIPLAKAREMAQDALVLARQAVDPVAARRASARAAEAAKSAELTLDTFLTEYLDVQRAEGIETAPERVAAISRHAPALARKPLRDLSRRDLVEAIDIVRGKYPSAAVTLRATLHRIFEVAVDRGLVDANPLAGHRARRGSLKTKNVAEAKREDEALSIDSLARLWVAAGDPRVNPTFGRYVRLLIGTGARRTELTKAVIAGLRAAGDGLPAQLLLAAPTTKTGRSHTLYLPPLLLSEIDHVQRRHDDTLAFPGRGGRQMTGWSKLTPPLVEAARRLGATDRVHLHAFRKAFRTGLSALGVDRVVAELMLNHSQDKLIQTYDKHRFERERASAAVRWCDALAAAIAKVEAERSTAPEPGMPRKTAAA